MYAIYVFHALCYNIFAAGDAEIQNKVRIQYFRDGQGTRFRWRRFGMAIPGGD